MEMYFANPTTLGKFFELVLGVDGVDPAQLLTLYNSILRELFLIKAACELLTLRIAWIDFTSFCQRSGSQLKFLAKEFVRHLLQASNLVAEQEAVLKKIEELRVLASPEIRHATNDHDFIALLTFDNRSVANKRGLRNIAAVQAALMGCLDFFELKKEPLFTTLDQHIGLP